MGRPIPAGCAQQCCRDSADARLQYQRNLGFRPRKRTTCGQSELAVGFGPTQVRLPGSGDLIKTADAG